MAGSLPLIRENSYRASNRNPSPNPDPVKRDLTMVGVSPLPGCGIVFSIMWQARATVRKSGQDPQGCPYEIQAKIHRDAKNS